MDTLEATVTKEQLNATKFFEKAQKKQQPLYFRYDEVADWLIVQFVPQNKETIVHYLDDQVALLYLPDSLEVVGFQVEDFVTVFLENNPDLKNTWNRTFKMSLGDMIAKAEESKPKIAEEILTSYRDLFHQKHTIATSAI